jgi:hypothetical protein
MYLLVIYTSVLWSRWEILSSIKWFNLMLNIIGQCQCDIVQIMVLTDKYNNNNNVSFKGQITAYLRSIKPVLSNHLSYVTILHSSLRWSHKTRLTVWHLLIFFTKKQSNLHFPGVMYRPCVIIGTLL